MSISKPDLTIFEVPKITWLILKKTFLTNLILLLILNLLVKPIWIFGIDRTVQNTVGAAEYGLYFSLFSFSILFNILLDMGITNFNNREIAIHPQLVSKYFSNLVVLKVILGVLYVGFSFAIGTIIGYSEKHIMLLVFLLINQLLGAATLYFRSNLSGLHHFKTDSVISVLDRFLMIVFCGILLYSPLTRATFKIEWFVYAQTVAYFTTAAVSFILVYKKTTFFRPRFDFNFLLTIFKRSYPFAILTLLMSFYYRIDSVMLERMIPDGEMEAGIYAQAFRLLDAANMVPFLFGGLLLPIFASMIAKKQEVVSLMKLSFNLLITPVVGLAAFVFFYRVEIIELLYLSHVESTSSILGILMFSFLSISLSYIFGTLLTSNGSMKIINLISLAGVITNIGLNLVLIPRYGAVGASFASLTTQAISVFLQFYFCYKIFKVNMAWQEVFWQTTYFTIAITTPMILHLYNQRLGVGIIVSASVCIVAAIAFRRINFKALFKILRQEDV